VAVRSGIQDLNHFIHGLGTIFGLQTQVEDIENRLNILCLKVFDYATSAGLLQDKQCLIFEFSLEVDHLSKLTIIG